MANGLESLLGATPEEAAALQRIAALRAAGLSDEQIFGGMTLGGGYEFLPFVSSLAGITSSYNLGRGGLAAEQLAREDRLVASPYNVVAANQFYADGGGSPNLTDPTLANVPRSPASRYQDYIDSILFPNGESGVSGTQPQTVAAPATSATAQTGGMIPGVVAPGQSATAPATAPSAGVYDPSAAQAASAVQLAGQLPGMTNPQFRNTLASGSIPGFSAFNQRDFGRMTPDQRAQYFGQVQSTGRASDAQAAYDDFIRRYRSGGSTITGTAR